MKVLENSMYTPREAADIAGREDGAADCVQVIGSKFVLYLQKQKESRNTLICCYKIGAEQWDRRSCILFGGTFDPPHNGHMTLLAGAIEAVRPDLVLVEPAGTPPHKRAGGTSAAHRLAMCECFRRFPEPVLDTTGDRARRQKLYH